MIRRALVLLLILSAGCARLPEGDPGSLSRCRKVNVCLIRGFLDWYSGGVDQIAVDLRKAGIPAETFREDQWRDITAKLIEEPCQPIILVGFSYGADDVILIAKRLGGAHQPVALLITIDPVTPGKIPANVQRCVNFYEPDGIWDIFPWLRGIPVQGDSPANVENINVRERPDLNLPGTSHATIAQNANIHLAVKRLIMAIAGDEAMPRR